MVMENWTESVVLPQRFYIMCLTLDGIPLFSRAYGDLPALPFPVVGSLNGVHMFIKNNAANLGVTNAENAKIIWQEFLNIKLIVVSFTESSEFHLKLLLESVYKCFVMIVGEKEFSKITNVEKLKKKLRLTLPLVLNYLSGKSLLLGNITQVPDTILCPDVSLLQNCLNAYTEDCQSEFGCLTLNGKIIVGTEKFWQLLPIETSLILYLLETVPTTQASDFPIYLPNGSPTVPHRLVIANLIENVDVLIICSTEPSLQEIMQKYIQKYWLPFLPVLKSCTRLHPRCFSSDIKLDVNLLAFILINTSDEKCLSSFYPHGNMTGADQMYFSELEKRKQALTDFYKEVVSETFLERSDSDFTHEVIETYKCTTQFKCYGMKTSNRQLFTLFTLDIPTYALGNISRQILKQLTKSGYI